MEELSFALSVVVFNLAASSGLFSKKKIDNNIFYLLIAITLSFVSLTAPTQLIGHNITLFWPFEAVLLYRLYQKPNIRIIGLASLIVQTAMMISLLIDWFNVYGSLSLPLPVIIIKGLITTIFAAAATCLLFILKRDFL